MRRLSWYESVTKCLTLARCYWRGPAHSSRVGVQVLPRQTGAAANSSRRTRARLLIASMLVGEYTHRLSDRQHFHVSVTDRSAKLVWRGSFEGRCMKGFVLLRSSNYNSLEGIATLENFTTVLAVSPKQAINNNCFRLI